MSTTTPHTADLVFTDAASAQKRNLSDAFTSVLQTGGGLTALLAEGDNLVDGSKHEWLEDKQTSESDTLNNSGAVASGVTSFVVTDGTKFASGMVIKWRDYYETMLVTNVSTHTLTVTRDLNSAGQPASVADGSTVDIINRPETQHSDGTALAHQRQTPQYNYYEIFHEYIDLPVEFRVTQKYGFASAEEYEAFQEAVLMRKIRSRMNASLIWNERTNTEPDKTRGAFTWLLQSGTLKYDKSAAALTPTFINDANQAVLEADASASDLALYTDMIQARRMAKFNTMLANRMEMINWDQAQSSGQHFVNVFVGDLAMLGVSRIVVDLSKYCPKGTILGLTIPKLRIIYPPSGRMISWTEKPAKKHPDTRQLHVYVRCALEMKDSLYSHYMLYNMAKTLS